MAIRLASCFVAAYMLQHISTSVAFEAVRMPPLAHRVDESPNDGLVAAFAKQCTRLLASCILGDLNDGH
jgi:hypothetical protein